MKNANFSVKATLGKSITTALVAAAILSGCSKESSKPAESNDLLSVAAIRNDPTMTPADKAETLALAAERLMTPTSFMYADFIASQALAIDAKNVRARYWKAALGPVMVAKGIMTRIEPFSKRDERRFVEYQKSVSDLKQTRAKDVAEFLLDGPKDIETERDIQDFVAAVTAKLDAARETMKDLKNEELVLRLNEAQFKRSSHDPSVKACQVTETAPEVYKLDGCELTSVHEVRLNRADFEMLQQSIAGYQVYLTILNSYDLTGISTVDDGTKKSADAKIEDLLKNPRFGKVRDGRSLGAIPLLAKDALVGYRYAQSIQSELCPAGARANRSGHFFKEGVCIKATTELEQGIARVEAALNGAATVVPFKINGQEHSVTVDVNGFFTNPVADVRELTPIVRNQCGDVTSIGNGTAGGSFPTGDLNKLLQLNAQTSSCSQF